MPRDLGEHDRWNLAVRAGSRIQWLGRNHREDPAKAPRGADRGAVVTRVPADGGLHPEILQPHRLAARRPRRCPAASAAPKAPAAFHRAVFQRRVKDHLARYSTRFALSGLGQLMLALTSALLLLVTVVLGLHVGSWLAGGALAWFVFVWYLLPLRSRVRTRR